MQFDLCSPASKATPRRERRLIIIHTTVERALSPRGKQVSTAPDFSPAIFQHGKKTAEAVTNAAPKIYRGSFGHVLRWTGDFAYGATQPKDLGENFVVENK